jgi:hypothetical protein
MLLDDSSTGAEEATMYHHSIALALAEARIADLQNAAAHNASTASPRRRRVVALGRAAIAALRPASVPAQPTHDAATLAKVQAQAIHRHH